MPNRENTRLSDLLTTTRHDTLAALKDIDLEQIIHPESGWRVRDMVAHLIAWDIAAVQALQCLQSGKVDAMPDYSNIEAYHDPEVAKRRDIPAEDLFAEWAAIHEEFKAVVESIPTERMETPFPFPWGDQGTGSFLVEEMASHEQEHREEIQKLV